MTLAPRCNARITEWELRHTFWEDLARSGRDPGDLRNMTETTCDTLHVPTNVGFTNGPAGRHRSNT